MENNTKDIIFKEEAMVHYKEIYRVALRMTRKKDEAEELVQDTFMQAWKSFASYEPGTNCRAWLYQILMNKNTGLRRKRFSESKHFQEADEFILENAVHPGSIPEYLTDETVISALDDLPDHHRSIILLIDVYGFKYNEVSAISKIPIGTVMSRLNRARATLRHSLADTAKENGIIKSQGSA